MILQNNSRDLCNGNGSGNFLLPGDIKLTVELSHYFGISLVRSSDIHMKLIYHEMLYLYK